VSGHELPAPLPPNEDVREPALAGDRRAFDHSFGCHAAGDHSRFVIEHHSHFIHIVSDQLYIRIRGLLEAFQILFPGGDSAAGMAGLIDADGFMVGFDGSEINGPAEVEVTLRQIFDHHQTPPYVARVKSVRFLNSDVAVLRAAAGMIPPGKSDLDPALNAVQTLVAVRSNDQWRITVFQNTPAAFHGRPELVEKFTQELREELRGTESDR